MMTKKTLSELSELYQLDTHTHLTKLSLGELRLSGNDTVSEYEMSREPYSQKSGWINHSNEQIFQVMTFK